MPSPGMQLNSPRYYKREVGRAKPRPLPYLCTTYRSSNVRLLQAPSPAGPGPFGCASSSAGAKGGRGVSCCKRPRLPSSTAAACLPCRCLSPSVRTSRGECSLHKHSPYHHLDWLPLQARPDRRSLAEGLVPAPAPAPAPGDALVAPAPSPMLSPLLTTPSASPAPSGT